MKPVRQFKSVNNLKPGRSLFDLSYEKKFTCDMGQLIPIMCDEVVPGDIFEIGNAAVIRFQPMVAPILHEINMYTHYFYVPYRLLWDDWEEFISGGVDGEDATAIPTWSPTSHGLNSLWDYLGFPDTVATGAEPIDFPRRAYNMVYNEYYRDETLQTEVALTSESILNRNWEKDYFTSALTNQQRGTSPALPIQGNTSAVWGSGHFVSGSTGTQMLASTTALDPVIRANSGNAVTNLFNLFNDNSVDLSVATSFDIADLRLAIQIQRWMERNQRAGVRYTEFLKSHFGVAPSDDRLQRPEYIGGTKSPVIISEVLQTSQTDTTPQGSMAGHGLGIQSGFAGKYHAKEYGLIIGIMSIMPKPSYQQGINRQRLRRTRYDFYFPEFANLSEQAIIRAELYTTAVSADNNTIFGYQGRYDEMRVKQNQVCSGMRDSYDYWHLGRKFSSSPLLNSSFIVCSPDKRIFAVTTEPGLIVSFANNIRALRPLPIMAEPGRIDHD